MFNSDLHSAWKWKYPNNINFRRHQRYFEIWMVLETIEMKRKDEVIQTKHFAKPLFYIFTMKRTKDPLIKEFMFFLTHIFIFGLILGLILGLSIGLFFRLFFGLKCIASSSSSSSWVGSDQAVHDWWIPNYLSLEIIIF